VADPSGASSSGGETLREPSRTGGRRPESLAARSIQVACDRCSQGVMDATTPHMLGTCPCSCHLRPGHEGACDV
jgi:hypothetical protein